jgi:hypothetical protein
MKSLWAMLWQQTTCPRQSMRQTFVLLGLSVNIKSNLQPQSRTLKNMIQMNRTTELNGQCKIQVTKLSLQTPWSDAGTWRSLIHRQTKQTSFIQESWHEGKYIHTVSQIWSLIGLLSIVTIRAPNSTPIVRSWTGWNLLSVNCKSRHDFPTPVLQRKKETHVKKNHRNIHESQIY